ncbi:sigma-70 family RNA polymerase sigma factor [uncultured Arcticibacterium sp.]|uniref:RNA polymerase sigma factor n=1 Tax=uncultured Arcticibacterium sp. TaxID=2173042 RepID=UPI0030F7CA9F
MNTENAFVETIKENEALIYKVTAVYGNDSEDRKDLYQEIVLQLWKAFEKFKNQSQISTWLYRVALNTAISRLRKTKKEGQMVSFDAGLHVLEDSYDPVLEQRSKDLYQHISMLNDIEKAVILLFLEDKSHQEIAQITGLTVSNVGTRMGRIKEKLKKGIAKV